MWRLVPEGSEGLCRAEESSEWGSCGRGQSREETGGGEVEIYSKKKSDYNIKATGLPWSWNLVLQSCIKLSVEQIGL